MATYNIYSDPSHGWMKVSIHKLIKYGIANNISRYSYYRNGSVYLEEDRDMKLFVVTAKKHGEHIKVRQFNGNRSSRLRSYEPFNKSLHE